MLEIAVPAARNRIAMDEFLNPEGENEADELEEDEQMVQDAFDALVAAGEVDEREEEAEEDEEPQAPPLTLEEKLKALSITAALLAERDNGVILRAMPGIQALQHELRIEKREKKEQTKIVDFFKPRARKL
jgi:hypothetical protein